LGKIGKHNNDKNKSFKMKLNYFGDMMTEEFAGYVNGFKNDVAGLVRRLLVNASNSTSNTSTPTSIDWTTKGVVTPVKNQGNCGGCWSFSATGATECNIAIKTGKLVSLSEQNLLDCSSSYGNAGCSGGNQNLAFKYMIANGGLCNTTSYPYKAVAGTCKSTTCGVKYGKITKFSYVTANSETALQNAVTSGCVSVAVEASSDFQFYSSGIFTSTNCGTSLNHAVLVVGYGVSGTQKYWKVKNSWGTYWGEQGYIRICKNCARNGNSGQCGIAMYPSFPVV